jgi:hypothetical protein
MIVLSLYVSTVNSELAFPAYENGVIFAVLIALCFLSKFPLTTNFCLIGTVTVNVGENVADTTSNS